MVFILQTAAGILSEATHQHAGARPLRLGLARQDPERGHPQRGARPTARGGRSPPRWCSSRSSPSRSTSSTRRWKGSSTRGCGSDERRPSSRSTISACTISPASAAKMQAVDGVSFSLQKGRDSRASPGESGCGKTTLVSGCMGLYIPPLHHTSGDVRIDGKSIIGMSIEQNRKEVLGRQIAMIPQGALNSLNPTRKIKDLAADMILSHDENGRQERHSRPAPRALRAHRARSPTRCSNAYPVQLPAGMKQRVVIGISHAAEPAGGHRRRAHLRARRLHAKGGHSTAVRSAWTRESSGACSSSPTSCRFFVTCRARSR